MISERVNLASSLEDLYSGFNEFNPILDSKSLQYDESFQQAVIKSSYGKRKSVNEPRTSGPSQMGTVGYNRNSLASSNRRKSFTSAMYNKPTTSERPMTAVSGAGYTSNKRSPAGSALFDPLNQAKSHSPFQFKDENNIEVKLKELELKVNKLLEESILVSARGEVRLALEKAKDAVAKERLLCKQKEQNSNTISIPVNIDLTFAVIFNLAIQFTKNEMYADAINTYQSLLKCRSFTNTGRLKLNIGKIYFVQGNYSKAIKFFRMALDQIPTAQKYARMRIMRNIGLSFIKLNQYTDAISLFEYIISEKSNFRDALHLIVCHYALGDRESMIKAFLKLLEIQFNPWPEKCGAILDEDDPTVSLMNEAIKNDQLRKLEREKLHERDWCLLMSAKLIAPVIGETFSQGYDWCVEEMKNAGYLDLVNDLEINKAVKHLKKREFNEAISTLKSFEKKEGKAASTAATNLSFLFLIQSEIDQAEKYADEAVNVDHFNPGALVNKGNCCFKHEDYERAKEYYKEALTNESTCVEALYNLALAYKKLSQLDKALDCLFKFNSLIPNHVHVLFQIANIYEQLNDSDQALEWFQQLLTLVPSDPTFLNRLSDINMAESDKHSAFSYLNDSYRYFPSHIPTIEKMAIHYIETHAYEKAIQYLERASFNQPNQVKWFLMIAACYRKSGNYQQALHYYKMIHRKFPENIDCVKFLIRICHDLSLPDLNEYSEKLKKLEKNKDVRERKIQSGSKLSSGRSNRRSADSSRGDSASSNSSGYMTSTSTSSRLVHKRKLGIETIDGKVNEDNLLLDEDVLKEVERPTTSWGKKYDDFENDEIADILPE